MDKKEKLAFVAVAAFAIGVMGFALGGDPWNWASTVNSETVAVCSWIVIVAFIAANFLTTAALWLKQNHSHFLWDDVPLVAAYTVAFGVFLGVLVLIIDAYGSINAQMMEAMSYPTAAMISLGLLVLGIYFACRCWNAYVRKDFWATVQGICTSCLMIAVAGIISCVVGILPQSWIGFCVYLVMVCMILVLAAIIIPEYRERKASRK